MQQNSNDAIRERWIIVAIWLLFAVLLAIVTSQHELFGDEVQPWLWVRYEHNLFAAMRYLRYEGHPALWTILLFALSRISANVLLLQLTNYLIAVGCAWLILSFRPLPLLLRVLVIFGGSYFFIAGVLARSYMLSGLLLVGAARCLLSNPKRHWLAMGLLALAINTHFLAIPVAAAIFICLYWLGPEMKSTAAIQRMKDRSFWLSIALLGSSLAVCYITVRPAPDIETTLDIPGASLFDYFVLGVGRLWHYFLPLSIQSSATIQQGNLSLSSFADLAISILLFVVAVSVLPSRRSRLFMITASFLWVCAAVLTVRRPLLTHATLLAIIYIIALLIRRPEDEPGAIFDDYAAQPLLITLVAVQVFGCLQLCIKEITQPFASGKAVANWIESAGLTQHPLVSQPELAALSVAAYTGAASVYFPGCQCSRPSLLYRRGWQSTRSVTPEELKALKSETGLDPVLLSGWKLSESEQNELGVRFAFKAPEGWAWDNENVDVYVADATCK